jgi:TfoX/Sxy family transcriptional regulator of competence genes
MAYDEYLAERMERILSTKKYSFTAKRMMGGLCFMVDDKMCFGIVKDQMMARIDPGIYQESLIKAGVNEMNFTGRPMKGYVFIEPAVIDREDDLEYWIDRCLEFNPKAKSSKKK